MLNLPAKIKYEKKEKGILLQFFSLRQKYRLLLNLQSRFVVILYNIIKCISFNGSSSNLFDHINQFLCAQFWRLLFCPCHAVYFGGIINCSVQVICTKIQGHLSCTSSDHSPICFYMRKII